MTVQKAPWKRLCEESTRQYKQQKAIQEGNEVHYFLSDSALAAAAKRKKRAVATVAAAMAKTKSKIKSKTSSKSRAKVSAKIVKKSTTSVKVCPKDCRVAVS